MGHSKAKLFCETRNLELCDIKDLCQGSQIPMEKTSTWMAGKAVEDSSPVAIQIGKRQVFCQTYKSAFNEPATWLDKDTQMTHDGNSDGYGRMYESGYSFRTVMYCCGKKGEPSFILPCVLKGV